MAVHKNFINRRIERAKGEALIEVVIALSILMIALGYSSSVIVGGTSQISVSQNRMIATSLAKEGLEGMRNIIGSNLLRLSEDRTACWNAGFEADGIPIQDIEYCGTKIGTTILDVTQTFRLVFRRADGYFSLLDEGSTDISTIWNIPEFGLFLIDQNRHLVDPDAPAVGSEQFIFVDQNQVELRTGIGETLPQARFYRAIQIRYRDLDTPSDSVPDFMEVTSAVAWGSGETNAIQLSTFLTPFVP